jgi:hypothetical protein
VPALERLYEGLPEPGVENSQSEFLDEVVEAAWKIELSDALGVAKEAQSFPIGRGKHAEVPSEEIERAKAHAQDLIKQPSVIERLCPALRYASDELGEVAKIVGAAMIPLTVGPQAVLPLTPLAFGALAVVVVRAGVRSLCPPESGKSDS